jgi:hypothetical protein
MQGVVKGGMHTHANNMSDRHAYLRSTASQHAHTSRRVPRCSNRRAAGRTHMHNGARGSLRKPQASSAAQVDASARARAHTHTHTHTHTHRRKASPTDMHRDTRGTSTEHTARQRAHVGSGNSDSDALHGGAGPGAALPATHDDARAAPQTASSPRQPVDAQEGRGGGIHPRPPWGRQRKPKPCGAIAMRASRSKRTAVPARFEAPTLCLD